MKKRRKRSPEVRKRAKLWKVFAAYIKERDGKRCFTCGREILSPQGHHAGHFIPKKIGGPELYFHPKNVHSQCFHCNINLGGYGERYAERMEEVYGRETVDKLRRLKTESVSEFDYDEQIETYTRRLEQLRSNGRELEGQEDKTP